MEDNIASLRAACLCVLCIANRYLSLLGFFGNN